MSTAAFTTHPGCTADQLTQYATQGFLICRGVFARHEMAELDAESAALMRRHDLISPRNLRCRFMPHHASGEPLFEVFDPVNDIAPICTRFTADPRLLALLESIYGEPPLLFKEKLIFKPPGARGYNLHQDIPLSWANFPRSFVTVLIAIDESTRANGCTEVFAGYHHDFLSPNPAEYMLPDETVDPAHRAWLELSPGDVAIFHGLTPHRSEPNRSSQTRRTFYVSYNAASDGGDQRAAHYSEFQDKMRARLLAQSPDDVFFR